MRIYTDGSYRAKTGKGAFGIIIDDGSDEPIKLVDTEENTTNNVMEMKAVLMALYYIIANDIEPETVEIISDSIYVVDGINSWYPKWARNGLRLPTGKEIKNRDLWVELATAANQVKCKISWVKGHAKCAGNNAIDKLVARETESP